MVCNTFSVSAHFVTFYYRAAWNADAVLRLEFYLSVRLSVRLSVCLSVRLTVKRVHCNQAKKDLSRFFKNTKEHLA